MVFVGGQCTVHQTSVAHLVPVAGHPVEAGMLEIVGCTESLRINGVGERLSVGFGQIVVQPVVTDGYGHCHFAYVEEMFRIPVREVADAQQFFSGPLGIHFLIGNSVGIGQEKDSLQGFPGCTQDSPPDLHPFERSLFKIAVADIEDAFVNHPHGSVVFNQFFNSAFFSGFQKKTGMSGYPAIVESLSGQCHSYHKEKRYKKTFFSYI